MSKKILFISESIWTQGVVYDLHSLSEGLASKGFEVFAADPSIDTVDNDAKYIDVLRSNLGQSVKLVNFKFRASVTWFNISDNDVRDGFWVLKRWLFLYRKLKIVIESENIDCIVLYSAARMGLQATILAKTHNVPIIFRNVDILYNLWPNAVQRAIVLVFEKLIYRHMDHVFAYSVAYSNYLVRFGASKKKISIASQALDLDLFRPTSKNKDFMKLWGIDPRRTVVTFMGNFYPFGGLLEFVEKLVPFRDDSVTFLFVGDGEIRPEMEALVKKYALDEIVIITGLQPYEDMPKFINVSDLCLNIFPVNKRTSDIFSAKVAQYLACGKPVICSSMPGIMDMMPTEKTGVLYVETVDDIVSSIRAFLNGKLKISNSGAGLDFVKKNHSIDSIVKKLQLKIEEITK